MLFWLHLFFLFYYFLKFFRPCEIAFEVKNIKRNILRFILSFQSWQKDRHRSKFKRSKFIRLDAKRAIRFIQTPAPALLYGLQSSAPAPGSHFLLMFIAFLHFLILMQIDLLCASVTTDILKQAQTLKKIILCRQFFLIFGIVWRRIQNPLEHLA